MKFTQALKENKYLLGAFILLILAYFAFDPRTPTLQAADQKSIQPDTLIPPGYLMLPLDLANIDTVQGLIESHGVVDLYTGGQSGTTAKKVASRIKIFRAPRNPNQFAVMAPDSVVESLMKHGGPFWAVLQNRSVDTKQIEQAHIPKARPVQIEYQTGG